MVSTVPMAERRKTAVIIGAGPAGLTAALELLRQTDVTPVVSRRRATIGGISRTVDFNGYRMDIGGHRFFSKSDWVMDWWQEILPLEPAAARAASGSPSATRQPRSAGPAGRRGHRRRRGQIGSCSCAAACRASISCAASSTTRSSSTSRTVINLGPGALREGGRELPVRLAVPAANRAHARGLPRQPLRPRALPDVLRVVHRKGLGRAVHGDQRRVGRAADQGPVADRGGLHALRRSVAPAPATREETRRASSSSSSIRSWAGAALGGVARRVRAGGGEIRRGNVVERCRRRDGRVAA